MSAQPQQGQQNVPTFKLVLVGDGGVGKVSSNFFYILREKFSTSGVVALTWF